MPPPTRAGKGLEEDDSELSEFYMNPSKFLNRTTRDLMSSPVSQKFMATDNLNHYPVACMGVSSFGIQSTPSLSNPGFSRGFGSPTGGGGFSSSSLPSRSLAPQQGGPSPGTVSSSRGLLPFENRSGLLAGPQSRLPDGSKRSSNPLGLKEQARDQQAVPNGLKYYTRDGGFEPPTVDEQSSGKNTSVANLFSNGLSGFRSVGASSIGGLSVGPGRVVGSHGVVGANYHNPLGSGADTPSILDLSEFPTLSSRGHSDTQPHHNPMAGRAPYVGMVKQPTTESSEFQMSSEDFPALPGSQNTDPLSSGEGKGDSSNPPTNQTNDVPKGESGVSNRAPGAEKSQAAKRGIQTTPEGKVTNIPPGMVSDQFGMVGLLTFIRAADDPNLVALALGCDLTTLGLNLNQPENLLNTFGGPWMEVHCQPHNIDYNVPSEYLINSSMRDKLAPVKLNRYGDDLLFYLFYTNIGDVIQIAAAIELYNRDWRYHKEERVWITRAPGIPPTEKTDTFERGTYYFFDTNNWRKVAKEFHLDYEKLEQRPQLPGNSTTSTTGPSGL